MRSDTEQGRTSIVCGLIAMLFIGLTYVWPLFSGPIEELFGYSRAETSLAFTLAVGCMSLGHICSGFLSRRFSYKTIVRLGGILIGAGYVLTAFSSNIAMLYITYSVMTGTGIGMVYNATMSVIPRWFLEKQGIVSGVLLMAFAISTSMMSLISSAILAHAGIVTTFIAIGVIELIVLPSVSFGYSSPKNLGARNSSAEGTPDAARQTASRNISTREMLHTPFFYLYFTLVTFWMVISLGFVNHASLMMQEELSLSVSGAAIVVSVMSLCNGIARPLSGILFDRINMNALLHLWGALFIVGSAGTCAALAIHSLPLAIGSTCVVLVCYGGQGALVPMITRKVYGEKYFSLNYAMMNQVALSSAAGPGVFGAMEVATGGYAMPFTVMLGLSLGTFLLTFVLRKSVASLMPSEQSSEENAKRRIDHDGASA